MKRTCLPAIIIFALALSTTLLAREHPDSPWALGGDIDLATYATPDLPAHFEPGVWQPLDNTPQRNPTTDAGARLGRMLFYDLRLSASGNTSCASCHVQEMAFAGPGRTSVGHGGQVLDRNAMSLVNLRFSRAGFFWDERAATIEQAVSTALYNPIEMGQTPQQVVRVVMNDPRYQPYIQAAYGSSAITASQVIDAIAQFTRTMVSANARYDQAAAQADTMQEDFPAFTPRENRGKALFIERCNLCHHIGESKVVNFFGMFRTLDNGLDPQRTERDGGMGDITFNPREVGTFKSPSLRNVQVTGPYMHDGRFETLAQVIDHYANTPGIEPSSRFSYSPQDKADLIAFLNTLTDESFLADPRFSNPWQDQQPPSPPQGIELPGDVHLRRDAFTDIASLTPAQRIAQGLGLPRDQINPWLQSLDTDADGKLSAEELQPVAQAMVNAGQVRALAPGRRGPQSQSARRGRGPASSPQDLPRRIDFNHDGKIDPAETRMTASLNRMATLGDGGRLEVILDRMLARWPLTTPQLLEVRKVIRKHKQHQAAAIHQQNLRTLASLRELLGLQAYQQYQQRVAASDTPMSSQPPIAQQLDDARKAVMAFDADEDHLLDAREIESLTQAMQRVRGGFGVIDRANPMLQSSDAIEAFVTRYLKYYDPENRGSADVNLLPERMAPLAMEADIDHDRRLTPQEIRSHIRRTAFDRMIQSGIYIGGGFTNTIARRTDVIDQLKLSDDTRAQAMALLEQHSRRVDELTETARVQITDDVQRCLAP